MVLNQRKSPTAVSSSFQVELPTVCGETESQEKFRPEDDPDRYPGKFPLFMCYLNNCLNVSTFTFIIPISIEFTKYLGGTQFLSGVAISMQCFLSAISGPVFYFYTRRYGLKNTFLVCTAFFIVGQFLYVVSCPMRSYWLLVISRCIGGCGAQLVPYWYAARAVGINKRTQVGQYLNAATASGYAFGPFVSSLMFHLTKDAAVVRWDEESHEEVILSYDNEWWNRVTSAAWLLLLLMVVEFLLFVFWFREPTKETNEDISPTGESPWKGIVSMTRREIWAFFIALFSTFCLPIIIASWEIYSINEAVLNWGWSTQIGCVYVGCVFVFLLPMSIFVGNAVESYGISDRDGMVSFGVVAVVGFFFMYDFFPNDNDAVTVVVYTIGSVVLLTGFQIARGFCWALLSKMVPTHSKGISNVLMFMFYIAGRGTGSIIGQSFRVNKQSLPQVDYGLLGFTPWSPRNTYAWSMQLLCLFLTILWGVHYRILVPCSRAT